MPKEFDLKKSQMKCYNTLALKVDFLRSRVKYLARETERDREKERKEKE